MKQTILVLYGGKSGEHEVSCRSAASILAHLSARWNILACGVSRDGLWYLQDEGLAAQARAGLAVLPIVEDSARRVSALPGQGLATSTGPLAVDVVFNIIHGTTGEDGRVQGLLDLCGIPCAGSGVLGSALGMDKYRAKQVWVAAGLPVVPFVHLRACDFADSARRTALLSECVSRLGLPLFVKPSNCGSSVGVGRANDAESLETAVNHALRFDSSVLVEKAVNGREIEVSVVGNDNPKAYGPGEIVSHHQFYDYDAKYLDPDGAALLLPAPLNDSQRANVLAMAVQAYLAVGAEGFSRVDFFLDRDSGAWFINEINTLPGFTSVSMFPMMCAQGGLEYADLLDKLAELGMERYQKNAALSTNARE